MNPEQKWTLYEEEVKDCLKKNIDVNVWTVNAEEDMKRMADLGVSAIITNYPDVAKRVLRGDEL